MSGESCQGSQNAQFLPLHITDGNEIVGIRKGKRPVEVNGFNVCMGQDGPDQTTGGAFKADLLRG